MFLAFGYRIGVYACLIHLTRLRPFSCHKDINSYFLALNITSTMEHSLQMVIAAGCAYWLRESLTVWYAYQIQFLMLMWLTVSWSLLIPLVVPANNTVLAVGFFMAFFGTLLICGNGGGSQFSINSSEHALDCDCSLCFRSSL